MPWGFSARHPTSVIFSLDFGPDDKSTSFSVSKFCFR